MDTPAVERLRARFDVDYRPALVDDAAALANAVADVDAWIVRNRTQVSGATLAAARRLRVVGRLGVGLDNIDVEACEARAITVIPATGANAESVAEYVIATAMMMLRGAAYRSTAAVAAGRWPRQMLAQGRELSGKVLGLVGFGGIGQITARKANALGMRVIACDNAVDPSAALWRENGTKPVSLDALLAESDVVSLHVPLTPQTRGLLNAGRLELMKRGAMLVNTARGGIVDELALAKALHEGRLGGAAIDVFDDEPLKAGNSLVDVPNLILTPHIAGVTQEANERVSALVADRVAAALAR
ncbi:(S)-sulfolactate dehydrogenase [Usitatibacter palustris]|uniref:(S)-sulfolactate dehydrogenase n=2 Tax=Usitatibacter palustris TaxID=2732487 RepID=A0A6M4HAZ3_9PROT|nr:(S)-sulfolactate dehydrogenase [Usitatibacter palustris]